MNIKAVGPASRGHLRNGLAGPHNYAYRGEATLEVELRYECERGCGRRSSVAFQVCAVCRGYYDRANGKVKP